MAKGKHAAALFEVIHSGREQAQRPILSTPKWWWKRRSKHAVTTTSMFAAPNPGNVESPPPSASSESFADATVENDPTLSHPMAQQREEPISAPSSTTPDEPAAALKHAVDLNLDPERRLITFKFSYNSAIIGAFTLAVVVMLAYLVGKKMNAGPAPAIATETTAQLRNKPARPDVLNVNPGTRTGVQQQQTQQHVEPDIGTSSRATDATDAERVTGAAPAASHEQGTTANSPQDRVLGLNYVVVQSYPDEKGAIEARDMLIKNGVPATIEQKLRGLNQNWFIVVGMQGFPRASGAEYEAYLKKIQDVSASFARSKKSFKAFQPIPYKWDKPGSQKAVG